MIFFIQLAEPDHFETWASFTTEEREQFFAQMQAFSAAVAERGRVIAGAGLDHPRAAKTVRPGPDRPVTDGPYAEAAEQLGGFYLIDLPDMDTATELARLLPEGKGISIEIRPTTDE